MSPSRSARNTQANTTGPSLVQEALRRAGRRDQLRATRAAERAEKAALARELRAARIAVGKHGAYGRGAARIGHSIRLQAHTAPTHTMRSLYPYTTAPGLGVPGAYMGPEVYTGANFLFSPYELYARKKITAPNMSIIGVIGSGKSALQKSMILRLLPFGVRFSWVQVKPEYEDLCAALGIEPLTIGPGQLARLNPLAEVRRHPDQTVQQWRAANRVRRVSLVKGMLEVQLGRRVSEIESAVIGWSLDAATGEAFVDRGELTPVSLPVLLTAMTDTEQWAQQATDLGVSPRAALRESQAARLGLAELVNGSLRGMFDSTDSRNTAFDAQAPGTLLDLSSVRQNQQLTVLSMVCAQSAMEAELMFPGAGHRIIGYDEAWMSMRYLELLRRMQEQWKLARMYGVANLVALHRFSDLNAVGDEGSEARKLAEGLIEDTDIQICYRQNKASLPLTRELLGLSETETGLLRYLPVGVALWRIRGTGSVVKHQLDQLERPLIHTDSRMEVEAGLDDVDPEEWARILEDWAADAKAGTR